MKIKLNASLIHYNGNLLLSGKKNYQLPEPKSEKTKQFLSALASGLSLDALNEYLTDKECALFFAALKQRQLINSITNKYVDTSLEKTYEFLNYHLGDITNPFDFKKGIHVAIIGCGGTGANIALCLASSGIESLSLLDFDHVQVSNLNRQFAYDSRDIGCHKTARLKEKLHRINPALKISTFERKISQSSDLDCLAEDVNLLVSAIDRPAIKSSMYVIEYAIKRDIAVIFGAVGYDSITAGPLLTDQQAKHNYLQALQNISSVHTQPIAGSIASTNLILSAILANNITAWFYPFAQAELQNVRKIYHPVTLNLVGETQYGSQ